MGLIGNALGLVGFSWGNVASKVAKPFVGDTAAELLGVAIDLKNHNIGGVIHNGKDLLEAQQSQGVPCAAEGAYPSPQSALGGASSTGFAAGGIGAVLGAGAIGGLLGGGLLGGGMTSGRLGGGLFGGLASGGLAKMVLGGLGGAAVMKAGAGLFGGALGGGGAGIGSTLMSVMGPGGAFQAETDVRNKLGATYTAGGPGARVNALPANACFEDLVAAFMYDVVKDMQDEATAKMDEIRKSIDTGEAQTAASGVKGFVQGVASKLTGGAAGDAANAGKGEDSRNLMFEELKNTMQKLAQMQQALSSVINTMHEQAMSAIRNIKA